MWYCLRIDGKRYTHGVGGSCVFGFMLACTKPAHVPGQYAVLNTYVDRFTRKIIVN